MCIRPGIMFLSTVILGLYSPSRNINVYLRPLIDELNKLWSFEVLTYNISRKKVFKMKTSSIWIINDFPLYGMILSRSTHEKLTCSYCMKKIRPSPQMVVKLLFLLFLLEVIAKSLLIQKYHKGHFER
jgi:hypothetical protein